MLPPPPPPLAPAAAFADVGGVVCFCWHSYTWKYDSDSATIWGSTSITTRSCFECCVLSVRWFQEQRQKHKQGREAGQQHKQLGREKFSLKCTITGSARLITTNSSAQPDEALQHDLMERNLATKFATTSALSSSLLSHLHLIPGLLHRPVYVHPVVGSEQQHKAAAIKRKKHNSPNRGSELTVEA